MFVSVAALAVGFVDAAAAAAAAVGASAVVAL